MNAGDFDLAVAKDGKAYYYYERVHSELICADLTEDYTNVTGFYSTHFPRKQPPDVREAAAYLKDLAQEKTREADYVWLPFRFDGEMGYPDWKDTWRLSDYE